MEGIEALKEFLSESRKIVIVTHPRPDGDAMGSSLALNRYLEKKGHQSLVILPTEYPDYFKWMAGSKDALIYPFRKDQCITAIETCDIIFCLDFNTLSRVAPVNKYISKRKEESDIPIVLIDHHLQPDTFDYMLHRVKASSTCELIYEFYELMEGSDYKADKKMAECLFTGLVTDTGSFQNNNTTAEAFDLAAKLMRCSIDANSIRDKVFCNFKEKRVRFIGNALVDRMKVIRPMKMAYMWVTKEDVRTYDLDAGDTEGLVNYPLTIRGIQAAVLLKEHGDIIKISFRSKGDLSVNEFARKHFSGGGHKNAAGGRSDKSLDATITEMLLHWKKEFGH